ncbi:MAG TPA: DedA family protein [Acetobacteraceae bacterium]|jgi:membrane protein DedA with SNARE-associated domain|nr:DedA family protein [Acetobacteraceae bacterium]
MNLIHPHTLIGLLHTCGYAGVALGVGLECLGLPVPGEGLLIMAAIYAGSTHNLNPYLVGAAAAGGAVLGQLAGYGIGLTAGYRLLRRYGHRIGLTWRRLALGRLLFRRHGVKLIIIARFVILLRMVAAVLAGANRMPVRNFIIANVVGSAIWAAFYSVGATMLGKQMKHASGPIGIAVGVVAVLVFVVGSVMMHRHERRLTAASPVQMRRRELARASH